MHVEWSPASKSENSDTVKIHDRRIGTKIRPNRMKVSANLPTEEDLATIKRKKKVVCCNMFHNYGYNLLIYLQYFITKSCKTYVLTE